MPFFSWSLPSREVRPGVTQQALPPRTPQLHWTLLSVSKSASTTLLSSMQLTLHATRPPHNDASRLVQAMPAWLVKTRRAPSRHCSDARVLWSYKYGHAAVQVVSTSYTATPHCGARLALLRGVQRFSSLVDWRSIHCTEVR